MTVVIKSRLGLIAEQAIPKASAAVRKTAFDIEAGAKERAPVDTGNLEGSIAAQMQGPLAARVIAGAEYAVYVEYGSTHGARLGQGKTQSAYGGMFSTTHVWNVSGYTIAPQPFMVPAAHAAEAPFLAAMKQVFE